MSFFVTADETKRLEMLMTDYELSTLNQRAFDTITITTLGFGLTVISAIGALLTKACRPEPPLFAWLKLGSTPPNCTDVSPYILLAVPTIPVMVLSILIVQGTIATARNRYIRSLEAQIRTLMSIDDNAVVPFGFVHLSQRVSGGSRSVSWRLAFLARFQWIPAAFIATGVGFAAIALIGQPTLQTIAAITYGVMAFALVSGVFVGYLSSAPLWDRLVGELPSELKHTRDGFPSDNRGRNLRYVLLPRPTELLAKAPLHAMAYFIASRIQGHGIPVAHILLFTLILELVLYQARYTVNDLRDIEQDSKHTGVRLRGRLENSEAGVRTGLTALSIRLFLIPLLFIVLPTRSLEIMFAISIGVVVLATIVYESAKTRARTVRVEFEKKTEYIYAIYLAVGVGYGLRVGAGIHLGGLGWIAVVLGTSFGFLLGIVLVVMAWTLEGYSFKSKDEVKKLKPHVAYLTLQVEGLRWDDEIKVRLHAQILKHKPPIHSVIYFAFASAIFAACVLGIVLERELPMVGYEPLLVVVMIGIGIAVCAIVANVRVSLIYAIGAFAFFALTFIVASMRIKWGVALFPMAVTTAFYFSYGNMSYSDANIDFLLVALKVRKLVGDVWRSVFNFLFRDDAYWLRFGVYFAEDKLAREEKLQRRIKELSK